MYGGSDLRESCCSVIKPPESIWASHWRKAIAQAKVPKFSPQHLLPKGSQREGDVKALKEKALAFDCGEQQSGGIDNADLLDRPMVGLHIRFLMFWLSQYNLSHRMVISIKHDNSCVHQPWAEYI